MKKIEPVRFNLIFFIIIGSSIRPLAVGLPIQVPPAFTKNNSSFIFLHFLVCKLLVTISSAPFRFDVGRCITGDNYEWLGIWKKTGRALHLLHRVRIISTKCMKKIKKILSKSTFGCRRSPICAELQVFLVYKWLSYLDKYLPIVCNMKRVL